MYRLILVVGFFSHALNITGQALFPTLQLADSIVAAEPEWVDLDNDGLLDIMLLLKSNTNNNYLGIIKGDTLNPLGKFEQVTPIAAHLAYLIVDYNNDNAMDILISGEKSGVKSTFIYLNLGSFQFEEHKTSIPAFSIARFADLESDASPEVLVSGEDVNGFYFRILSQVSDFTWDTVYDSISIKNSAIEVMDADGDGDMDFFMSGKLKPDSLFSGFLINKGGFYFEVNQPLPLAGLASSGDLNNDGRFDVILMGEDANGLWHNKKIQSTSEAYTVQDMPVVLKQGKPFIADFNYDGQSDVHYYGTSLTGIENVIHYSNGTTAALDGQVLSQRFGDADHDGNLELIQLMDNFATLLILRPLFTKLNNGPRIPTGAVALPVFDRVFMYWEKPADDHTPSNSLTFDVHLTGVDEYQSGEFDLLNEKRLTVTHGNNGTSNFKLLKDVNLADLKFAIQAIDNSFHSGKPCYGDGRGQSCVTLATEELSVCSDEYVPLRSSSVDAYWFSFAKGFLGTGSQYDFAPDASDTIFYYVPRSQCPVLTVWAISVKNDTLKVEENERFACTGAEIMFSVEEEWDNISWTSQLKGDLGNSKSIVYPFEIPDSVTVTMSNAEGCTVIRKTAVKVSKPELVLQADQYKIMKGSDVQLSVDGAQRYTWAPQAGLSDYSIANPIASPMESTRYEVTGYDSLDCMDTKPVTITVEDTGFIPSLFSPNGDEQNDQLKIYGVVSAQRFTFSIYDREGSLVYRTSDINEVVQRGWDGTKNGTKQPPGIYFWKVKGELQSGPLLLNGKDAGSIVLIR